MRHGLEFTANYTLSKAFDGAQVAGIERHLQRHRLSHRSVQPQAGIRAFSDLDQRQRFVANGVWMPQLQNLPQAGRTADSERLGAFHHRDHVHRPAGDAVRQRRTRAALDGGVTGGVSYAGPTNGRAGWLPRNSFTAAGLPQRGFPAGTAVRDFGERLKLSLLGEAFNLFNHTNVSSVNTTAFNYSAAGSGLCAGHTNACYVAEPGIHVPHRHQ